MTGTLRTALVEPTVQRRAALEQTWHRLNPEGSLDRSLAYLGYRASTEPGASRLVLCDDDGELQAAVLATWTTPATAMFSDPWKMLCSQQFLRAEDDDHGLFVEHQHALDACVGRAGCAPEQLRSALGEVVVARLFDSSEVLQAPDTDARAEDQLLAVVRRLRQTVVDGHAGAVAFPFVDPADTELRAVLEAEGFRHGVVTGSSSHRLPPDADDFEAVVASLPKRRRRRYRKELQALDDAGLRLGAVDLAENLERVTELESATMRAHGGTMQPARLAEIRRELLGTFPGRVRVPAARAGDRIVACGVDLHDAHDYYALTYGADYSWPDLSTAYMCVGYYEPLAFAARQGIRRLRFGFEAFLPKVVRGATVTPRELWLWTPDPIALDRLGQVLTMIDARTRPFLASPDPETRRA